MRLDFYATIHKALRRELMLLTVDVGTTDASDSTAVGRLAGRLAELLALLDEHAKHEDAIIAPMIARAAPELHRMIEETHVSIDARFAQLAPLFANAASAADGERKPRLELARRSLTSAVSAYLSHMQDEEERVMPALWAAFSEEELLTAQRIIQGSIGPGTMARFLSIMMPAMNPDERFDMLAGIRANASLPAYRAMLTVAKATLNEADGEALEARLGATAA